MKRQELEQQYFRALAWTENTGRSLLILALGIAFFQLSRDPATSYRPMVVFIGSLHWRYSLFGNFFICAALFRLAAAEEDSLYRSLLFGGIFLFTAHALFSHGDRTGLFGTPALLDTFAAWYPTLLILHLFGRISNRQRRWISFPASILPLLSSFALLALNITALMMSLTTIPIIRTLLHISVLKTGATAGMLHFSTGIVQILLLVYLRFKKERIFPEFRKLEAMVYLDKKGNI